MPASGAPGWPATPVRPFYDFSRADGSELALSGLLPAVAVLHPPASATRPVPGRTGIARAGPVVRTGRDLREIPGQLCGRCAGDVLAVAADGQIWPCVFSRWLPVGDVRTTPLGEILAGDRLARVRGELAAHFAGRPCAPNMCNPQCGPSCSPACRPASNCRPVGACMPWYR
jgi:hypothetical protein